jgi:anti-anti-sigma factor
MSEPADSYLVGSFEQEILVGTIVGPHFQDEKMADAVQRELLELLNRHNANKIIISFQNIKYISSVAFRPLLHLRRALMETGGRMILCCVSKVIGDVFYTTRLLTRVGESAAPFEIAPDVASAVAVLKGESSSI